MMTDRVRSLRDDMRDWTDTVCPHRARIVTESDRRNQRDSKVIRRATALQDVLEQMPIYLRDGDLIVGTPTSTPGAWIALPEFSLGTEQIVQHRHGVDVGQTFIRDGLPEDVKEYWATRNLHAHYAAFRRECFDDTTPPPSLEDWVAQRVETLGVESGEDLALLSPEDLLAPDLPDYIRAELDRTFPRRLELRDATYAVHYDLRKRLVTLEKTAGRRRDPPPRMWLPAFKGFRVEVKTGAVLHRY